MMKTAQQVPDMNKDIECARRVLGEEAHALTLLADTVGDEFVKALDLIEAATGRVIVTGMGKSGHIARKIAATMASTWTPAMFVHPGEASHGDLGMIKRGEDVIIALSYSGSSAELSDTVEFAKRFSVPLISITGNADSMLAKKADALLLLPKLKEACPNNQAPTTSTTMQIAMGDALAVALLERKNISSEQFKVFHPGGKLGRSIMRVKEIMRTADTVPFVSASTPAEAVLEAMTKGGLGMVCVSDDNKTLLGVVTDGDVRRHALNNTLRDHVATDIMTKNPKTLDIDALGAEAIAIMNEKSITALPVLENGQIAGVVHIHDCLRAAIA